MQTVMAGIGAMYLGLYGGPLHGERYEVLRDERWNWATELRLSIAGKIAPALYVLTTDAKGQTYYCYKGWDFSHAD